MTKIYHVVLMLFFAIDATAAGRRIAVLEHRADVRRSQALVSALAQELSTSTANTIIAGAEAERLFGAGLAAAVARCRGMARCIAGVGQRLNVDEVILVGISQLGDLIVAIQRIDVASKRVLARLADTLSARRKPSAVLIKRYLTRLLPPEDFRRYGRIVVTSDLPGDRVLLDGKYQGKTPLSPLVVDAPGRYTVRILRAEHAPFETRLDVLPEAAVEVRATLVRRISTQKHWYERWWVWTLIGAAVAGGATAAAVATRPGPSQVDAVLRWQP